MNKSYFIFKKEVQNYFLSPIAYIITGFFILLSGYFFSTFLISQKLANLAGFFLNTSTTFLFIMPILTMNLLAGEASDGTEELLFTLPVKIYSVVLGKYFSAVFLLLFMLSITFVYPIILFIYGSPEIGTMISGYLGIFLIGSASISIGIFSSSLTNNQVSSAITGFFILLIFWVIDWIAGVIPFLNRELLNWFSIIDHLNIFIEGIISLKGIIYYLTIIIIFLFLTILNIDRKRWS